MISRGRAAFPAAQSDLRTRAYELPARTVPDELASPKHQGHEAPAAKIKNFAHWLCLSKTRVFERAGQEERINPKNRLNISQNSFLIVASQKVYGRLSLERAIHAEEKSEERPCGLAERAGTPPRS